jgi:NAD(P)-dependent dehydrogenase (short-subunit alcohol dehydrogenase family)
MNRVAIVTGGAVRIGRALSLRLAEAGCDVCVHYHSSREEADQLAGQIQKSGRRAIAVQADLRQPVESAAIIMERCQSELGPASVLVNSAAIFEPCSLDEVTADNWQRHVDLNLAAPVFLSQAFARQAPKDLKGNIINILDWRATKPVPGHLPYTISKAGLAALTKLLAQELAPRIRVNAIAPGAILPLAGQDQASFQSLSAQIPLNRTGTPQDVADAMLFLLESDFITGEILHLTGGQQL